MFIKIIIDLIESIGYTYCLSNYLKKNERYKKKYTFLLVIISFLILQVNSMIDNIDDISIITINIFGFMYSYLFFSNSILEIFYILLFTESMILYGNIIALISASYGLQIPLSKLLLEPLNFEMVSLYSTILYLGIIIAISRIKIVHSSVSSKSIIYLFIVYLISFVSTRYFFIEILKGKLDYGHNDLIVLLLSSIFILLYFMYNKLKEENEKYIENILIQEETKNMKEYLNAFSLLYEENKKIRHDLKNALLILKEGSEDKEENIEEIQKFSYVLPNFFSTNNTFNDIVNSKILLYKEKKVDWHFFIESDLKRIKKLDLALILGNLLDNACENLGKEGIVEIHTKVINQLYFINIRNSIDFSILDNNPKLTTKKHDKCFHGFGIKSVNKIVQNYNGHILFSEQEGYFSVDIFLEVPIVTKDNLS